MRRFYKPTLWIPQLFLLPNPNLHHGLLTETEDVADSGYPFWSPDSTRIGFFSGGRLKRVDANGGVVATLSNAQDPHGGAWSQDGFIVFTRSGSDNNEFLYRVAASGGNEAQITTVDKHHLRDVHRWPSFLPDGHHVLLTCSETEEYYKDGESGIRTREGGCIADTTSKEQLPADADGPGQYVNGLMLFVAEDGNLTAQPFDPSKRTFIGDRWPVAQQIARDEILRIDSFSASPSGVLAYMSGERALSQLVWRNRQGQAIETVEPAGTYDGIALSPDQQRIATSRSDSPDDRYLWIQDVSRGSVSRFSDKSGQNRQLVWSRDDSKVAYAATVPPGAIYVKTNANRGKEESLFKALSTEAVNVPTDFSPDGRILLYINFVCGVGSKLWVHPFAEGQKDYPLLRTDSPEREAQFSSDGRWLAYVSEETSRPEVYVAPFPALSTKIQVSTAGGSQPRWRRDGKEIFFVAPDGTMNAVSLDAKGDTLKAGIPHGLFRTQMTAATHGFYQYDVTADGQKFIVNSRTEQAVQPITLYVNWDSGMKKP